MVENAQQDQNQVADYKSGGQEMDKLESLGILVLQNHTRLARMLHLTEERAELDPPFMVDESLWEKPATIAAFEDSSAQVDVLAITHRSEAFQGFVDTFLDTQIETSVIEFVHFLLAASYATRGENEVIE